MSQSISTSKLLLMGLYASGKSTIKSVVFEGKDPKDFIDKAYSATINYQRDIKSMIGTEFQIFDLGLTFFRRAEFSVCANYLDIYALKSPKKISSAH